MCLSLQVFSVDCLENTRLSSKTQLEAIVVGSFLCVIIYMNMIPFYSSRYPKCHDRGQTQKCGIMIYMNV